VDGPLGDLEGPRVCAKVTNSFSGNGRQATTFTSHYCIVAVSEGLSEEFNA